VRGPDIGMLPRTQPRPSLGSARAEPLAVSHVFPGGGPARRGSPDAEVDRPRERAALTPSPLAGEGGEGGGSIELTARTLRRNLTEAERQLWRRLRLQQLGGHRFRRQQPLGPYIVDFICLEKRLIVEVDGGQHAEEAESDAQRTGWLEAQGFRVLRFWNTEVLQQIETVKEMIWAALSDEKHPPTSILPRRGGGGRRRG